MKAKQQMSMRLDLMEYGAKLGYPRLPFAFGKHVAAGEDAWRKFATAASILKIAPALRHARTRSDYQPASSPPPPDNDMAARRRAWLAKAREAKAAKKEAALSQ